ncbi:unnamed protein product [Euphydryas editha]|uniref:Transposase n=1 Tax=Euphydryas editha TaxID=104508 RepID=A0AAU9TYY8_EUPED|nr:unnamed protein product [Euphydryas editha]
MLAKILENPEFLNKILWTDESTFKRDEYLNLHNYHEWRVENPHLMREDRSQYQFKQDGCPAHYARAVRDYLNEEYPDRRIGSSGSIFWPPCSPDLNPVVFFYWGCIKEKDFKTNTKSIRTSPEN